MNLPKLVNGVTDAMLESTVAWKIASFASQDWAGSFDRADLRNLAEISAQCQFTDSFTRLEVLLTLCRRKDVKPEVAIAAFADEWSVCDAVGDLQFPTWLLLHQIRDAGVDFQRFIPPSCRAWFDGLADWLIIHRGCSAGDEGGLSWTTSRNVAERFARGFRVRVRDSTVDCFEVDKSAVLFATNSRREFEVLVDAVDPEEIESEPFCALQL